MDILPFEIIKDFLDEMTFSYSSIQLFNQCKRGWYNNYILKCEKCGNFFSDVGTFAHKILEMYSTNKIDLFDLTQYLEYNWNSAIQYEAPNIRGCNDMEEKYYFQLYDFFSSFEGFDDETIGTELEIHTTVDTDFGCKNIVGFIDRLSVKDGDYIVTDYKSKSTFTNRELKDYSRQLYLYSKYVLEKYGNFPKYLKFLLFREGKEYVIEFNKDDYNDTLSYMKQSIESIYKERNFDCEYNFFYCNNLCDSRLYCTFE